MVDRRVLLQNLLDTALASLEEASPAARAGLLKEARTIGAELAELDGDTSASEAPVTALDELARRRKARRA